MNVKLAQAQFENQKFQDKFKSFARDIENTADQNEKLQKVEKLLGDIFKIFLMDLNFRLSQPPQTILAPISIAPTAPKSTPKPAAVKKSPEPKAKPSLDAKKRRALSQQILRSRDAEQIKDDLNQLRSPDLNEALKTNGDVSALQLRLLRGQFVGDISYQTGETDQVQIQIQSNSGAKIPFSYRIDIWRASQQISSTSGKEISHFSSYEDPNAGIFIGFGNGGSYMQIFYNQIANSFYGNVYGQNAKGNLEFVGYIYLHRP